MTLAGTIVSTIGVIVVALAPLRKSLGAIAVHTNAILTASQRRGDALSDAAADAAGVTRPPPTAPPAEPTVPL